MSKQLKLRSTKDWFKKSETKWVLNALSTIPDGSERLNQLFDMDLAAWVRECNTLKSGTARKDFIATYKDLFDLIEKKGKPSKTAYHALSTMNGIVYPMTQVIYGWLKNGHKYKAGELLAPATNEQLQELQDLFPDNYLPICLVESYKIYGGISSPNVRLWGSMSLAPIDLVIEQTKERNTYHQENRTLPFGYDGAGNTWVLKLEKTKKPIRAYAYDVNHEEPNYLRSIDKRFCDIINKNHKIER